MEQKTEASQAVDERALFEAWSNATWKYNLRPANPDTADTYMEGETETAWMGWSARAALKAQPAPTEATEKPFGYFIVEGDDLPYPGSGFIHELAEGRAYRSVTPVYTHPAPTEAPKIVCTYPSSRHLPPCDECVAAGGCIQAGSKGVAKAPTEAQVDGLSPVYAWLERSTRNSPAEVANAARTMMAFYQGAEFPEAAQGEDSARLDDLATIRELDRLGMELGAKLVQMVGHLDNGIEYLPREAIMIAVTDWRSAWSKNTKARKPIDRARASAETGGVKS